MLHCLLSVCLILPFSGEIFFAPVAHKMTLGEAREECKKRNGGLASPGQLHAAWRQGLDRCDYGWLSDGSARHPVAVARIQCGGGLLGVRTMYRYRNQTGFPPPSMKLGAYCFKGKLMCAVMSPCVISGSRRGLGHRLFVWKTNFKMFGRSRAEELSACGVQTSVTVWSS